MKRVRPASPRAKPRSAPLDPARVRWLDAQLAELRCGCPWTKRNPDECPLRDVRKLDAEKIAAWLDGLTSEEKEYLVLYHQCCLAIKWEDARSRPKKPAQRRKS